VKRFAIITLLAAVMASGQADARLVAARAECLSACAPQIADACSDFRRANYNRCRLKLVRTCRRFGPAAVCPAPPPTTTTTTLVTTLPTTTTVPVGVPTTLPTSMPTSTTTVPVPLPTTSTTALPGIPDPTPPSTSPTTTTTLPVVPFAYRGGWGLAWEEVDTMPSCAPTFQTRWSFSPVVVGERSIVVQAYSGSSYNRVLLDEATVSYQQNQSLTATVTKDTEYYIETITYDVDFTSPTQATLTRTSVRDYYYKQCTEVSSAILSRG